MMAARNLAAVIGYPVSHSLSPILHKLWLDECGIDGDYIALSVEPHALSRTLPTLRDAGFLGLSVTAPHKEAVFSLADDLDSPSRTCGAVNLIVFQPDGRIEGRNTDAAGLAASLAEEIGIEYVNNRISVVVGAGGAARAAVVALDQLGVSEIRILARNPARAQTLLDQMARNIRASLTAMKWLDWDQAAKEASILLNATSAGMFGKPGLDLSLDPLPPAAAVYDLVYAPLQTALVRNAQARGHLSANGLGMLIHQAVPAFAAFYGVTPSITPALRAKLEKTLAK
jgi:shikimate dehydrogenase